LLSTYEEHPTLLVAGQLFELTRYGAAAGNLKPVADYLNKSWDGEISISIAGTGLGKTFAQVSWLDDPETGQFVDATIDLMAEDEPGEVGEPSLDPSSSILVNLDKVADRIGAQLW
jgi:hypothetical protein